MTTPTPTQALEPVEVTQADRDLVHDLLMPACETELERRALRYIKEGRGDDSEAVQKVARHRQSSNAASVGAGARETVARVLWDRLRDKMRGRKGGRSMPLWDTAQPEELAPYLADADAILASLATPTAEPVATVSKVETVTGDFYTEPGEPIWRVMVSEYCADFDFEQAAKNFAAAINSARLAAEPMAELQRLGQEYDGDALREALKEMTSLAADERDRTIQLSDLLERAREYVTDALEAHEHGDGRDLLGEIYRALSATPPAQEGEGIDAKQADVLHRAHLASLDSLATPATTVDESERLREALEAWADSIIMRCNDRDIPEGEIGAGYGGDVMRAAALTRAVLAGAERHG